MTSYLPIRQYGDLMENRPMESFSALMDVFYESREQEERTRQRGQDLIRSVTSARDRCRRKLAQQRQEFAKCQDRDQLRISGELITANLYRMERGQTKLTAENYYDPDCREITIPLDPLLTPQQNAAKYYKRYTKARTAEKYLTEQMAIAERDEAYLESVLEELRQAETEQDFLDIRAELRENGFLKRSGKEKKELKRATKPREFRTSGGWRVLVGRNNRQNDQLTTKTADYRDLWLHTQKIHGSHVILCCQGQEVPEEERYDGYLQLENGVGMLRLLFEEFTEGYKSLTGDERQEELSIATGKLAYPYISAMAEKIEEKFPNLEIHVFSIRNDFFGERITVSGLITAQDLTAQLKGERLGSRLLIPCNMLKTDEDVFLDDFTVRQVSDALQVPIDIVKSSGQDFIDAVIGEKQTDPDCKTERLI